jgi:hypothetical protein
MEHEEEDGFGSRLRADDDVEGFHQSSEDSEQLFSEKSVEHEDLYEEDPNVPQVRDVYQGEEGYNFEWDFTSTEGHPHDGPEVPPLLISEEGWGVSGNYGHLPEASQPQHQLFHVSDPPSRDAAGAIVEHEEDYEMVMVGTGANRGLKRKKKKKPEKQIVKLTPSPASDNTVHARLRGALIHPVDGASDSTVPPFEPHPVGRRTLAGVANTSEYDTLEYPQDTAFIYSGRDEADAWSSSSGEDVEEVVHRIARGKGSVPALMADGSQPLGIFLGMTEEEEEAAVAEGHHGESQKSGKRKPSKKGKRGRKSEGLDIRRVPFQRVALAEDLMRQVDLYKEASGLMLDGPLGVSANISDELLIQHSPIQSEMMLTTNREGDSSSSSASKEVSKGIPVVSPLTRIKQMFLKASRLPEEAAVIARAKELDNIQASIRFGNLNESQVHVNANIREYVHSGKEEAQRFLSTDPDAPADYLEEEYHREETIHEGRSGYSEHMLDDGGIAQQPASITRARSDTGEEYSILSLSVETDGVDPVHETSTGGGAVDDSAIGDVDEQMKDHAEAQALSKDEEEGAAPASSTLTAHESVVQHDREARSSEEYVLTKKMNGMTKRMVLHEKKIKKIVSDKNLDGLCNVMMKGTVMDVFMYDILECIRRRPTESVVLTNGSVLRGGSDSDAMARASSLRMAPARAVVWKETDIFSLSSQLVGLQMERLIYREKVMGVSGLWDDMTQSDKRAVLGDACDVSYCGRYFRPPVGFERPCMWETECVCYLIGQSNIFPDTLDRVVSDTSFIGREFYTPDEEAKLKNKTWPKARRACLLCYDMATLYAHYYYKRNDQSAPFLLQNHWNKTEGENAYSPALCFPLVDNDNRWTGFIAPKVMRILTSLRPYETNVHVNGTMKTVPCFVEACQDFWLASTALARSNRLETTEGAAHRS